MRTGRGTRQAEKPKKGVWIAAGCALTAAAMLFVLTLKKEDKALKIDSGKTEGQCIIHVLVDREVVEMELETYIAGVVAAEMPAYYDTEALKAQAVAARTYTLRKAERGGCSEAEGADICTRSGHCQAYADEDRLRERWGGDYDENAEKIKDAVTETRGQILVYNGEAIEALFHASAGGMTEDSENVYKNAQPYLRSVESPDEEGYIFTVKYTKKEVCGRIKKKLGVSLTESKLKSSLKVISRYESGRVENIAVGGETFSGKQFRGALGLSSANFEFAFSDDSITFTSKGYGHGTGMSQAGANVFAKQGMSYEEILAYYYNGAELEDWS